MPSHFTTPKRKRRLWIAPLVLVCILGAVYAGGVAFFKQTFMPRTTLNGEDVSLKGVELVAELRTNAYNAYSLDVTGQGLDFTIESGKVGLTADGEAAAADAIEQSDPLTWPLALIEDEPRELTVTDTLTCDRTKLLQVINDAIDAAKAADAKAGTATVYYDEAKKAYAVDESALVGLVDAEAVADAFMECALAGEKTLELDDSYLLSTATLDDCAAAANAYLAAAGELTLNDQTAYELTADKIREWVQVSDDYQVSINSSAINEWCHGELTDLLDTYGKERTYTRPDGKECTVKDGDNGYSTSTYGWVIDGDKCATAIEEALAAGTPMKVELPCILSAEKPVTIDGADWGKRYIDVDITEQHARMYDDEGALVWEADITTGQPKVTTDDGSTTSYSTPTGVWSVTNKKDGDVNLKGPIDEETGEPEWDSHVNFWVGVVGNLVGFHNAPWQESMGFGGTIYTWYGSHGCIRMSYASAEKLYSLVEVGDCVVIHE